VVQLAVAILRGRGTLSYTEWRHKGSRQGLRRGALFETWRILQIVWKGRAVIRNDGIGVLKYAARKWAIASCPPPVTVSKITVLPSRASKVTGRWTATLAFAAARG
jgi:hypothetical protein